MNMFSRLSHILAEWMIALCLFLFAWNKYLVITDTVLSQSFWGRIYLFEIPLVILVLLAGVLFLLRPYVVHDYSVIEKVSGLMILGLLLIVCYFLDDMQAIALLGLRIAMVVSIIYFWKRISHSAKNIIAAIGVASLFVQIIIAGGQIDTGASLGLTQWMGESVLSLGSTSIASFSVYGIDILRGYGTLPHPNILAFLAFVLYLSSLVLGHIKKPLRKMIQGLSLFLLFLTFSRVFWVLVVFLFIMRSKHKIFWAAFSGLLFLGGILLRGYQSLWERFDLYLPTLKLVLDNPLGVGVSQFITSIPAYYTEFFLWMAQPVHNTFLLIAVEIGWLWLFLFLCLFALSIYTLSQKYPLIAAEVFLSFLLVSMMDHILWTSVWGFYFLMMVLSIPFLHRLSMK